MAYKKEWKPQKKKGITKEMKICLILAVVFFLYGVTIKVLAPGGTGFFMVWILMAAIVTVAGVFFQKGIFKRIPMPVKTVGIAVCVVIFCSFLLIEGLVIRQMSMSGRDGLDYVIVLGAQVHKDRPSVVLKYRLDRAAEYLRDNPETICIVSGGQGSNEPYTEAYGMQQYLLQQGIDADRILIEDQSKTTQKICVSVKRRYRNQLQLELLPMISICSGHCKLQRTKVIRPARSVALPQDQQDSFCPITCCGISGKNKVSVKEGCGINLAAGD